MKKLLSAALLAFACLASLAPAQAQQATAYQDTVNNKVTIVPVTPANGLPVAIVSGGGGGGGGSGTEYTEDAASAANPVGGMIICRRRDTLSASEVSADSDNIALNCTSKGQAHVYVEGAVTLGAALPAGTNNIGDVDVVTLPALAAGSNVIGGVTQSGTWNVTNISGTVSLPTGAATAANQATLQGYVDGLETLITSTNTKLDTVITNTDRTADVAESATPSTVNLTQVNSTTLLAGNGATGTGSPRVTIANDNTPIPFSLNQLGGSTIAANAGNASATTLRVVVASDQAAIATSPAPTTTMGCTLSGTQSAASTNSTNIKASAGTVCGGVAVNTTATLYYLRLYNLASAPTCSSSTGFVTTIPVPASTSGNGTLINLGPFGGAFSTGIGFCITGGGSSTDNTSAATGVYLTLAYK